MKVIEYESFYNDYSVSQLNCIDLSIAAYIAQENKELYYTYCFLVAALNNYENQVFKNIKHKKDYEDAVRNEVLRLMGYSQVYKKANSKTELYELIKNCIEIKLPLIIDVKYQTLFFYKNYKDENEKKFTTLIANGYNEKNDTVNVLDMSLERQTFSKLFKGEFLYPIQIEMDMLDEIVKKTIELTKDYDEFIKNRTLFYIIEKSNDKPEISSLKEAISYFLRLIPNEDMINFSLKKLTDINNYKPNALEVVMKRHINSYQVIIDSLMLLLKDNPEYELISKSLLDFMKNRRMMVAGLSRTYIKNHYLSLDDLNNCNVKIKENIKVFSKLEDYICDDSKSIKENYVADSIITASTMLTDATYMSKRKVNLNEDCWLSKVTTINHWVKFDLKEIKSINEIIIYHYGDKKLNTRDFLILGSSDGNNYDSVFKVEDNRENITKISDLDIKYRFIKILITNPCQFDSRARLRNVVIR